MHTTESSRSVRIKSLERELQAARQQALASTWGRRKEVGPLEAHARKVRHKRLTWRLEDEARRKGGEKAVEEMHRKREEKRARMARATERLEEIEAEIERVRKRGEETVQRITKQITLIQAKMDAEAAKRAAERAEELEAQEEKESERVKGLYRPPSFRRGGATRHGAKTGGEGERHVATVPKKRQFGRSKTFAAKDGKEWWTQVQRGGGKAKNGVYHPRSFGSSSYAPPFFGSSASGTKFRRSSSSNKRSEVTSSSSPRPTSRQRSSTRRLHAAQKPAANNRWKK